MKKVIFVFVMIFIFAACEDKPKNPVSEYGDALIDAYNKGKQAGETANLDAVKKTIQAYHAANDKYPQNLEEIKNMIGSEIDMSKYNYDPQTGAVSIKGN